MRDERYEIYHKYEMALRNLNPSGWAQMNINEKIEAFQAIENKAAYETGRIPAEVVSGNLEPGCDAMQIDNTIVINETELVKPDYLNNIDSLYHEGSHITDFQAQFIPEVRKNFSEAEIAERNSIVPDPNIDYDGYFNHPAEVAAREAGVLGVERTIDEQDKIAQVDQIMHQPGNQILVTYDYIALNNSYDFATSPSTESSLEIDDGMDIDASLDSKGLDAD